MSELPPHIPVDHVVDGIYIASWRATRVANHLRAAGITNVLKLYEDIPHFPEGFNVCENALPDGEPIPPEKLKRGVKFVTDSVEAGERVLVMCGAGISRSATFVLAALVVRGYDVREAFLLLREQHSQSAPHPALWQSLIDYFDLDLSLDEAIHLTFSD